MIEGEVRDTDGTGLPGVFVRAVLDSAGTPLVQTDDTTRKFQIMVSMPGDYELCAIGVVEQRFVSTNCTGDVAEVTESSSTVIENLSIASGYYMSIETGPWNLTEGASPRLIVDYHVWNRSGAPDSTTWIVLGIEGSAQLDPILVENAGPRPGTEGRAFLDFTASSAGPIFARLVPTSTADEAIIAYGDNFSETAVGRNYVQIGMVDAN